MSKQRQGEYALELSTPIRHVATEIGGAAPAALSIKEMAATYKGLAAGDIHRVKVNEKLGSDAEATEWLLEYAVEQIMRRGKKGMGAEQIVRENGGYRLADGVATETLEYDGNPIGRDYDAHKTFRDPFNPLSENGIFSENVRAPKQKDDLKDLCESIEALGYVKDPGIVKDEHGVVLSGHRRLEALEKLGVDSTPHVTIKRFGDGDAADIERLKFALALNTAQKPFTAKDRKRIAEYLYGTGEYSMARIGELLKVPITTIHKDLEDIEKKTVIDINGRRRPPPGSLASLKPAIFKELDSGSSFKKTAAKFGVGTTTITRFVAERKLGNTLRECCHKEQPSSSKIPEDQQQAFIELVDNGMPQAQAVKAETGTSRQPSAPSSTMKKAAGRRSPR